MMVGFISQFLTLKQTSFGYYVCLPDQRWQPGQYVSVDKTKDINFLNFGHLLQEIFTYDRTEVRICQAT